MPRFLKPIPHQTKNGTKVMIFKVKHKRVFVSKSPTNLVRALLRKREAKEIKAAVKKVFKPGDKITNKISEVWVTRPNGVSTIIIKPRASRKHDQLIENLKGMAKRLPANQSKAILDSLHAPHYSAPGILKGNGITIKQMRKMGFEWWHLLYSYSFELEELKAAGMPVSVAIGEIEFGYTPGARDIARVWPEAAKAAYKKEQEIQGKGLL
jgi:hypothetical protein